MAFRETYSAEAHVPICKSLYRKDTCAELFSIIKNKNKKNNKIQLCMSMYIYIWSIKDYLNVKKSIYETY